jgi:hypothetical protein
MSADLVSWLRVELDADEQLALAAGGLDWHDDKHPSQEGRISDSAGNVVTYDEGAPTAAQAAHIATWSPRRALDEITVKRRLLNRYDHIIATIKKERASEPYDQVTRAGQAMADMVIFAVVLELAMPYAARPGWREEWATNV